LIYFFDRLTDKLK